MCAIKIKKTRALVLFSGGLDSILAARTLLEQGIDVLAVCFTSPFYGCGKALVSAKELGIECRVVDVSKDILELVKNPPSGYGKHLNPCIDCHSMMAKNAAKIMKEEEFDFIATGEVLGQRPFSQNRNALAQVSELAGTEILRPLSAKYLPKTDIENKGLVRRSGLHSIQGRTREYQSDLVIKYGIQDYPSPAGGCLLTDPGFSERLGRMLEYWPDCDSNDTEILKHGRVFWFVNAEDKERVLLIVGRHHADNQQLEKMKKRDDILLELVDINGPTSLIRKRGDNSFKLPETLQLDIPKELKFSTLNLDKAKATKEILNIACLLTGYYATKARGQSVKCKIVV